VKILGAYESNFPTPRVPSLSWLSLSSEIGSSVVICIIGFVESIVAVKIYATKVRVGGRREERE
jgi:MFS superfamily sulfate permease-like transporter